MATAAEGLVISVQDLVGAGFAHRGRHYRLAYLYISTGLADGLVNVEKGGPALSWIGPCDEPMHVTMWYVSRSRWVIEPVSQVQPVLTTNELLEPIRTGDYLYNGCLTGVVALILVSTVSGYIVI